MPRLRPELFHRAKKIDALLPLVLRATRDLGAARNELRWLKDFAIEKAAAAAQRKSKACSPKSWRHVLKDLCEQRSRGKPLQYILGTEYFGDLEITCRPGVLIPRQETAASVTHLVQRLIKPPKQLRVLDLCTGTGCIPLLFQHEFRKRHQALPVILGVDVSPKAIRLSEYNRARQTEIDRRFGSIYFVQADIMAEGGKSSWDVLISNPPYISPQAFNSTTSRSVRSFEPRLALVPEPRGNLLDIDLGDVFYPRLLSIAAKDDVKIILFEVADMAQAQRVVAMIRRHKLRWEGVEIWRDDPTADEDTGSEQYRGPPDEFIKVIGNGNGRSVFAWRKEASTWLGTQKYAGLPRMAS